MKIRFCPLQRSWNTFLPTNFTKNVTGTNTANGSEVRGLLQPFYTLKNENENRVQIQELLELKSLKTIKKIWAHIYLLSLRVSGGREICARGGWKLYVHVFGVYIYVKKISD